MIDELKSWAGLFATLLSMGAMFYTWLTSRAAANSKRLDKVEDTLKEQERLLTKLEGELAHLPTKDMVSKLDVEITRLAGSMEALSATLVGVGRTVDRMDSYLRKEPR